jgi:hypothetical protein
MTELPALLETQEAQGGEEDMSGNVKKFPANRIRRIPVNLPFERLPQCDHDSGMGEPPTEPCAKCAAQKKSPRRSEG